MAAISPSLYTGLSGGLCSTGAATRSLAVVAVAEGAVPLVELAPWIEGPRPRGRLRGPVIGRRPVGLGLPLEVAAACYGQRGDNERGQREGPSHDRSPLKASAPSGEAGSISV